MRHLLAILRELEIVCGRASDDGGPFNSSSVQGKREDGQDDDGPSKPHCETTDLPARRFGRPPESAHPHRGRNFIPKTKETIARSHRASRDARLSTGYGDEAIQRSLSARRRGPILRTMLAANEPRRRPKRLSRPTDTAASRGNVVLFCGGGNHAGTCRLLGGGRSPAEPVSVGRNSRLTGKITGNSRHFSLCSEFRSLSRLEFQRVKANFPCRRKRELFAQNRETRFANRRKIAPGLVIARPRLVCGVNA